MQGCRFFFFFFSLVALGFVSVFNVHGLTGVLVNISLGEAALWLNGSSISMSSAKFGNVPQIHFVH